MDNRRNEIFEGLKRHVADEMLEGKAIGLDADTPLLELGLIDSFSVIILQAFIRDRFQIEVPHSELFAKNLKNLGTLTDLLLRLEQSQHR
jgi:acyl carrier protein